MLVVQSVNQLDLKKVVMTETTMVELSVVMMVEMMVDLSEILLAV